MDRLLTDEEMFYVGMDVTKGGGNYAHIYEVITASAKAQDVKTLKVVGEWLEKWLEAKDKSGYVLVCFKEYLKRGEMPE